MAAEPNKPAKRIYGDVRDTGITFSEAMLRAMRSGREFTGPEAFAEWGVWSVSSLIYNLRRAGWQIDQKRDPLTGRAVYYMAWGKRRKLDGASYYPHYQIGV